MKLSLQVSHPKSLPPLAAVPRSSSLCHLWNGTASPGLLCKELFRGNMRNSISRELRSSTSTKPIPEGHSIAWCCPLSQAELRASCRIPFPLAANRQTEQVRPFLPAQIHSGLGTQLTRVLNHTHFGACPCSGAGRYFIAADAII